MIVVYIAHPIGGNVPSNLGAVEKIVANLFAANPELYPIAPYTVALKYLDDKHPVDRERGILMNKEYFNRRFINELWLFGNRISSGMWEEVCWAREFGIPVVPTNSKLAVALIRREYTTGSQMRVIVCGPGQDAIVTYLALGREKDGIYVSHRLHPRTFLWWGDIIYFAPIGKPIPQNYASAALGCFRF
ncbi:MAG: hypothetical protein ACM3KM_00385 [Acidobacteriaceae bacterium]